MDKCLLACKKPVCGRSCLSVCVSAVVMSFKSAFIKEFPCDSRQSTTHLNDRRASQICTPRLLCVSSVAFSYSACAAFLLNFHFLAAIHSISLMIEIAITCTINSRINQAINYLLSLNWPNKFESCVIKDIQVAHLN